MNNRQIWGKQKVINKTKYQRIKGSFEDRDRKMKGGQGVTRVTAVDEVEWRFNTKYLLRLGLAIAKKETGKDLLPARLNQGLGIPPAGFSEHCLLYHQYE